jgi:hypothetical protein
LALAREDLVGDMNVEYEVIFEAGPLGLGLRGQNPAGEGCVVYEFQKMKGAVLPAENSRKIALGDKVVGIAGHRVVDERYTVSELTKLIKSQQRPLKIRFSTRVPAELAPQRAEAVWDFESRNEYEMSLVKGAHLTITDTSKPDWWRGHDTCTNERGVFPSNRVKVLE